MKKYKKQINLFLYISLVIVIGSFTVLFINFRKQVRLQNEIFRIEQNLIQSDSLATLLLQIESDARGFQLTSDPGFLTSFFSIKLRCAAIIKSLKKNNITGDDARSITSVDSLLQLRISGLDSGVVVFTTQGPAAALAFMQIRGKKDIRQQLHQTLGSFKSRLLQKLQADTVGIRKSSNRNLYGLLLLLLIFIFLMFFAARRFKNAQQRVIKNQLKFKEAQRIAKIGSWEWDLATNKITWSQEQFRLFGEDRSTYAVTYDGYFSHLSASEQQNTKTLITDALEGHSGFAVEHEIIRKDGTRLMVFEQGTVLFDKDNKATGMFGTTQDITEQKKVEQQLVQAQKKFQAIFDNTADGIYQSTANGKFILANSAMAGILGYDNPAKMIDAVTDIGEQVYWDPADRMRMTQLLHEKGHIENFEVPLIRKNKEIVWVSESTRIVRNEEKTVVCFEGSLKDITKRKKAEIALNKSEERYRQIVETAQEGIWVLDENNYTVFVNKRMCDMLGYTREEMMGKQNYYFKDDEGKKAAKQDIERRKGGVTETQISKFISKSGEVIWTTVATNPIFDDEGTYTGALGMFTDITERKKADEELAEVQKKFRSIFDNTADGIYQSTADGQFIMANPSMARIFGYDTVDDLLQSVTDIGSQLYADPEERKKMSALLFEQGHVKNFELQVLTKTRDIIWVSANIRIVRDSNGAISYFEGTLEDITERKKAEDEILQLNKSLDQFANITAHDLQEPIRMVSGFLGLLHKKYCDILDEQGQSYIYRAKDGADRMSILIKDLLEFSRSGNKAAKKELVDLGVVMDLVDRDLSIVMADTGTIFRIPSSLPVVTGTQSALYRLFLNLVSNGIKFRKKDTSPEIDLTVTELQDAWEFKLQDNGIGVAEKDQPKLFQAFQRLHRRDEYPGTGLGLVTCKKIVETHGGKINMTSEEGKGTAFHFTVSKEQ